MLVNYMTRSVKLHRREFKRDRDRDIAPLATEVDKKFPRRGKCGVKTPLALFPFRVMGCRRSARVDTKNLFLHRACSGMQLKRVRAKE